MSPLFKVGDLVVRNPEVRDDAGWPYDDEVCRVVKHYPKHDEIVVVPVNRPPARHHNASWLAHNAPWLAERFTHVTTEAPRPARRNDPPTSKVAALAMIDFVEGPITALRTALAEQPAEQESVEIEMPEYHSHGMGCGLEDRGITDRYEAMEYGWYEAIDRVKEELANFGPLYTAPQPAKQPLTDEEIDNTTRKQVDDLLDHIYEYGTAAEGIDYRLRAIARAIERAHGIGEQE